MVFSNDGEAIRPRGPSALERASRRPDRQRRGPGCPSGRRWIILIESVAIW